MAKNRTHLEPESDEGLGTLTPKAPRYDSQSDSESESEPESQPPPTKPSIAASKKPQYPSSSSEESESEPDDSETQKPDPGVKPISSKSVADPQKPAPTTAKNQPKSFKAGGAVGPISPAKSAVKRPGADIEAKDSKRSKKKVEPESETTVKKSSNDDVKKQLFQRLWSEDDEIVILKGMIDYASKKKVDPVADLSDFHDFIKKSLHVDVTRTQLQDKIRRLKKKYVNNARKEKKGKERTFSKPHEQKSYDLSKKIWSKNKTDDNNTRVEGVDKVVHSSNISNGTKVDELILDEVKEDSKLSVEVENNEVRASRSSNSTVLPAGGVANVEEWIAKNSWLLSDDKRNEMQAKRRALKVAESELFLKRVELLGKQGKLVLDALRASGDSCFP